MLYTIKNENYRSNDEKSPSQFQKCTQTFIQREINRKVGTENENKVDF